MKRLLIILVILALPSLAQAEMFFIQRVVDGRTLMLLNGEQIRLIGVEIPVMEGSSNSSDKAAAFVRSLVSGTKVELQFAADLDAEGYKQAYAWFLYPREDVFTALEFKDDYRVNEVVEDWGEHRYVAFLNAVIIKAGYATPGENLDESEYSLLLTSLYHRPDMQVLNDSVPNLQVSVK